MKELALGLGVLRWGASRDEIVEKLPQARPRAEVRGQNPASGALFVIPAGMEIADFIELRPGVKVKASLEFQRGRLSCISLATKCHSGLSDDPALLRLTEQVVLQEAQLVADYLGVGPVRVGQAVQSWHLAGIDITLYIDCDDFEFELSVADEEDARLTG